MKKLFLATILLAVSTTSGQAASFNCQRASLPSEITICRYNNLGNLDENLAAKYSRLKRLASWQTWQTVRAEQRRWIRARNRCGYDDVCLTSQYRSRVRQLRHWLQDIGY